MATVINNKAQLAAINGSSGSYELGADILDWDLPPINVFYGDLDGKGYTITGTISTYTVGPYDKCAGVFYKLYGNVHDIVFKDCALTYAGVPMTGGILAAIIGRANTDAKTPEIYNITFINSSITVNANTPNSHGFYWGNVGFIAGYTEYVTISGCSVDSDCTISLTAVANAVYSAAGMLVGVMSGQASANYVSNCGAEGSIDCYSMDAVQAGGLCGQTQYVTYQDCLSSVVITSHTAGAHVYLGGIYGVGTAYGIVTINCYNSGALAGTATNKYGIGVGTVANSCYWLDSCGGSGGGGTSKTSAQLKQQATFVDWDFGTIWSIGEGSTYPILQNGALPILTLPATDVDYYKRSATFNGSSCGMSQVWFKWGGEGLENTSVKIPAAGRFSIYLHGATRGYTYYFQAVGMDAEGNLYYGDTLSFELTQSVAADAYVTKLIIRGQPLVPLETMTLVAKDDDSIAKYGKRSYSLSTQYSLNQDDTQVILNTILAANKDPRVNNLSITFQNLKPGAYKDSVIAADISTRITLINTLLGIDGDFFINNIKHTIVDAGLSYSVEWRLERVYDTTMEP